MNETESGGTPGPAEPADDAPAGEEPAGSEAPGAAEQTPGGPTYDVVLLVEQELAPEDAQQVTSLHSGVADPVHYHVLMPLENPAGRLEATMGTLAGGEMMAAPSLVLDEEQIDAARREAREDSRNALDATEARLRECGATVRAELIAEHPVDALGEKVTEVDGAEAIILTRPHIVAEFFHVDWTSRARRHLGVPVLHLLEHETFDEQASGEGEGTQGV